MKTAIIIPSRMDSSRYPGKPLAEICGIPMVGHCYYRALQSSAESDVFVATCDNEISHYIKSLGGHVVMTSNHHLRATTRTAEAIAILEKNTGISYDVVLMLQGDEPLVSPSIFGPLLKLFDDPSVKIANLISPIHEYSSFVDKNNVKVVTDDFGHALYFSREPIPSPWKGFANLNPFMQTGVIAFRKNYLFEFNHLQETSLEIIESVDMNRVLQSRLCDIHVLMSPTPTFAVDTPDDLRVAQSIMINDPIFISYAAS